MSEATPTSLDLLEQLGALPADERAARLRAHGDVDGRLQALVDAASSIIAVDTDRAIEATALVLGLADAAGTARSQARARRVRARALSYAGRFDEALAACLEAVDIATRAGHPVEAGRAHTSSMHALGELGRLDEAIDAGHEARTLLLSADESSLAARADNNLGLVYLRQDRPAAALRCFARARPLVQDEPMVRGHVDNSRGEALLALNDFAGAEEAFTDALDAFVSVDASLMAAVAQGNLADLNAREGRLSRALHAFEKARRRLERDGLPAHLARLLAEQAEAKAILGLPGEALREYRTALTDLDRFGLALQAARARCGMGLALLRLDRVAEAETALAASAIAFEELGHATDRAKVDLVRAELALRHGRTELARKIATRALANLDERPADAAAARHLLARVSIAAGDAETAEADLAAALAAARRLDLAPLLADILETRGRLHRQRRHAAAAVDDLSEAVGHIERIRGSLQAHRFRAAFHGRRSPAHEALVLSLLERAGADAVADAFAATEQARSRSLLDEVRGTIDAPQRGAAPDRGAEPDRAARSHSDPAESRLERDLARAQSELNALYSRLADDHPAGHDSESAAAWQADVHRREEVVAALESRLAAMQQGAGLYAPPVALADVQPHLESGEVLLEYFIADGEVLAFVIDTDRALVCRGLASARDAARALEQFRFQVDRALRPTGPSPRRSRRLLDDAHHALCTLDEMLLAPLRGRFEGARRLTIAPHGLLHLVPFPALRSDGRHLVEDHEVITVPSASLLAHLREAPRPQPHSGPLVVGVADEVAPLIADEAQRIAALIGCPNDRLLVGDDATAERVRELADGASAIHFACHGRSLAGNPFGSGLRLGDGWFTVRDILDLRLSARLVTLSGCETGLNVVEAGDELLGILRSFFAAGAGSIIVTLWPVDDRAATFLMSQLYGSWATDGTAPVGVGARLREAQLATLDRHPHPAFWAPFILAGQS